MRSSHSRLVARGLQALLGASLGCVQQAAPEPGTSRVSRVLEPSIRITALATLDDRDASMLRARSIISNAGGQPVRLIVGGCPLLVRAYTQPDASGSPAWSTLGADMVCKSIRRYIDLAADESRSVETIVPVSNILGDTLKEGRYTFTVTVRFIDPEFTTPEYPAGTLTLRR